MRVTVIFEDGVIIVDNTPKSGFTFTGIDSNWRVIQWMGNNGWIEVHRGDRVWLTDISIAQPFIDMYTAQVEPEPGEPTPPSVPESITRRQCALQLLAIGQITVQEALDMTKTAAVPAAISSIFGAQVANGAWTAEQRILAEIDFAATNYYRSNSLLSLMGLTSEQIDQFFIAAAVL
jgi:hypothetical protein